MKKKFSLRLNSNAVAVLLAALRTNQFETDDKDKCLLDLIIMVLERVGH